MKTFWENSFINGKGSTELHFVENLQMFVNNNKDKIEFDEIFAGNGQYFSAKSGDIEWRQVDGIRSKEDLLKHHRIGKPLRWTQINYNISRYYYNLVCSEIKKEFGKKNVFQYHVDSCYGKKELFLALSDACRCGYSFNNCEPNKVYENINQIDINSFYSSIMRTKNFPSKFEEASKDDFLEIHRAGTGYFGLFRIEVKEYDPFLCKIGVFDEKTKTLCGYFNNIDISFIIKLAGIKTLVCKKLWTCELEPMKESIIKAIDYAYGKKEELTGKEERLKYKMFLERLFGNCLKSRYYSEQRVWNKEEQSFKKIENDFDFSIEFQEKKLKGYFDYSWGIWILSYARLILLDFKKEIGSNCIYGDVDSLKFIGDIPTSIKLGTKLGEWKDEGKLKKFRVLDLKWYIGEYEDCEKNEKLKIACSGADKTIMENWLNSINNPVEAFSKSEFPENVKPFKTIVRNSDGTYTYQYFKDGGDIYGFQL